MAIYVRGDATPFVLIGKADDGRLVGYWSDDKKKLPHVTDLSRIVADGAATECAAVIARLPVVQPCTRHDRSIRCECVYRAACL